MINPSIETSIDSQPDRSFKRWVLSHWEILLVILILAAAVLTRFYDLGARGMSHDEVNHVIPAYDLYQGRGYQYNPMTHGPLQFHLMALSYFLFGDSDFSSRIPAAVFGVAAVAVALLLFRRYLGRIGALAAGLMVLISPTILYYSRYQRNEIFIVLWALLTIYAILRYLERGEQWVLFLFTAVNAFHFTDKATSYIFAAEELLFLAAYLVHRFAKREWPRPRFRLFFLLALSLSAVFLSAAAVLFKEFQPFTPTLKIIAFVSAGCGVAALAAVFVFLVSGLGWAGIRTERAFDLAMLLGSLILPLLVALVVELTGANPLEYSFSWTGWANWRALLQQSVVRSVIACVILAGIAIALGMWWKPRWLIHAALFYGIFAIFYSTFFTYMQGIAVGMVGALGYWMEQQGVNRGSQPWFYYIFMLVPLYEFLPALATLAGSFIASKSRLWQSQPGQPFQPVQPVQPPEETEVLVQPLQEPDGTEQTIPTPTVEQPAPTLEGPVPAVEQPAPTLEGPVPAVEQPIPTLEGPVPAVAQPVPTMALCVFWSIASLLAFSIAGEKMPWLTTHIAIPMILASGWTVGWLVESIQWKKVTAWGGRHFVRAFSLAFLGLLAVITARAAIRAAYIYYDYPYEYLVYAHGSGDPKMVAAQIEEISERTTGGLDMVVAYDEDVRYSYWWYMRHYPNRIDFGTTPTREVLNAPVILTSYKTYSKIMPLLGNNYNEFQYQRMWWPNEDYKVVDWPAISLERSRELGAEASPMGIVSYLQYVWKHISPFFTDKQVRNAIWEIWFNRDYTDYAALKGSSAFTLENWGVAQGMTVFIRKDVGALVWNFNTESVEPVEETDPYASVTVPVTPDLILGSAGIDPGQYQSPRDVAVAQDGSLYIVDSRNNRIQHVAPDGTVLLTWGSFADAASGNAPGGTFNEPWGVAVGPDGSVYVTDTWNHRIQKFTAAGQFVTMWGSGPSNGVNEFYGPRGIAVDVQGNVYVTDTGNKRVMIFDANGTYIKQFGTLGYAAGDLDEPVGIAVGPDGKVYIADTWNQRIQVFAPDAYGFSYTSIMQWTIRGWYGQSLENKPFLDIDANGNVFFTDPEGCRVIELSPVGEPLRVWGACGAAGGFIRPDGIAVDQDGGLWVIDATLGQIIHLPVEGQ